jgi:tRNA(fMet)-specific endonuclease VapC
MILLDTDICIELLKGNRRILQRRGQYEDPVGISFMSVAELYFGAEKSPNPPKNLAAIEALLLTMDIVQPDIPILKRFGMIKAELEKAGTVIPDADIFIASTAMETASKLITGNLRHFGRIPGLVMESWK